MTRFYQLNFNPSKKEPNYLYEHFSEVTPFGNMTLIVGVKQNVTPRKYKFYNTIKEAFFKVDGENYDLYQRCLSQSTYATIFEEIGTDTYKLAPLFGVLDTSQLETDDIFSIYFFDSR